MFEQAGKLFLGARESDGAAWLELVDEMAVLGWKQTNKVASTMSPQIATAILLVINPLRPLKETGCLLRFLDGLQELFLAFLVDPIYASTGGGVYMNGSNAHVREFA